MNRKFKSETEQPFSLTLDMSLNTKTEKNIKNVTGTKISDAELLKDLEDLIRTTNENITRASSEYEESLSISNDMNTSFSSVIADVIDEEAIIMKATKAMNQITISEHEVSLHSSENDLQDCDLIKELDTIMSVTANVQFKHSDKPEAIEYIKDTKASQSRMKQLDIKGLKFKSDTSKITEKSSNLQISTNTSDSTLLLRLKLPEVKKRLEHQVKFAIKMSHYYLHKNNRQEYDKKKALEMHNIKKQSQSSLELVESLSNLNENDSITVLKHQVQYEQQEELLDIPPNKIRIAITRVTGLDDLMLAFGTRDSSISPPDTFIQITLPSHIDEKNPQLYTSSTVKNSFHPQYPSCITMFQAERSKSFLKFLERKKLIIEVIQNRGLFRKNVILGKALIPLYDLLRQCEVIFNLKLIPEQQSRYKSHAEIHGTISTRIPFDMNHKKIIDKEFIHVDEHFVSFSPTVVNNESINKTVVNTYKSDKIDIDTLFYDSRSIISNLILEKEIEEMNDIISSSGSEKLRMIKDRKDSYELQKQIIVCQVEAGMLNPDAYISALKNAITKEKKRTLECKQMNRLDLSKKGLMRIKLMEQEIRELNAS